MPAAQIRDALQSTEATAQPPSLDFKTTDQPKPSQRPKCIKYVPVPGELQRKTHPHGPESTFCMPEKIPFGHIYYFTKGEFVGTGSTARVERLPSGHVSKTPLPNPYDPWTEQRNRESLTREYQVYCFVGPNLWALG